MELVTRGGLEYPGEYNSCGYQIWCRFVLLLRADQVFFGPRPFLLSKIDKNPIQSDY